MEVQEILDRTAKILINKGHCKGQSTEPETGRVCLMFAIRLAMDELFTLGQYDLTEEFMFVHDEINRRASMIGTPLNEEANLNFGASFNDDPNTSFGDVITLLSPDWEKLKP